MSTNKAENKELLAELQAAKSESKSVSEIAQSMSKETLAQTEAKTEQKEQLVTKQKSKTKRKNATTKIRQLADFIKTKTVRQLNKAVRKIEQQRRSYIVYANNDDKTTQVYYSTTYFNRKTNIEEQLNTSIARKLISEFIAKHVKTFEHFKTADIMKYYETKGSNYGDLVRIPLYEISLYCTVEQIQKDIDTVILRAKKLNRQCIYYNVADKDASRKVYEFVKIS